jgi:hypothetical protein
MGVFLVMTAPALQADEIQLGLETMLHADSNILRLPSDGELADGILGIKPIFDMRDKTDRGQYDLTYSPLYRQYFSHTNQSRLDHWGRFDGSYSFSPASLISIGARGFSTKGTRFDQDPGSGEVIAQDPGAQQSDHASVNLAFVHSFNPQIRLNARTEFQWFGFDRPIRQRGTTTDQIVEVDNRSLGGSLGMEYSFGPRTQIGAGLRASWQEFLGEKLPGVGAAGGDAFRRPPSTTIFSTLYFSFSHAISQTWNLSFTVGPTLADTDIASTQTALLPRYAMTPYDPLGGGPREYLFTTEALCAGSQYPCNFDVVNAERGTQAQFNEGKIVSYTNADFARWFSGSDPEFRFFALANVQKRWTHWVVNLSYERRDSAGSSQGASTILDTLRLQLDWRPDPRWSFRMQGAWVGRSNVSLVPDIRLGVTDSASAGTVNPVAETNDFYTVAASSQSQFNSDTIQAFLTGRYQITKNLSFKGRFLYQWQQSQRPIDLAATTGRTYQVFMLSAGVLYYFDPIRF